MTPSDIPNPLTGAASAKPPTISRELPRPATTATPPPGGLDTSLRVESILLKEFDYASLTAYQVYENRERIFNFYFTLMGALISGLGALYQIGENTSTPWQPLSFALLIVGGLLSLTFFVRLIHLRQSLRDSMITSYVIKEFYIQQFIERIPEIEQAFRWRLSTIPSGERPSSDTSFVTYPIALLGSASFGVGAFLGDQLWLASHHFSFLPLSPVAEPWIAGAFVFALVILLQFVYYRSELNTNKELTVLEAQARKLGISLGEAKHRHESTLLQQLQPWRHFGAE
ncbi:MAG: hypothetical protein ABI068_16910 [Ktedonobacterales bacterium]